MKLKKCNAALSLLTSLLLLLHLGYSVYAYLTFYYNPALTKLFSGLLMGAVCLHAVLGMCAVFLLGDGPGAALYPRQNRRTVAQRVSAALFFPLLILHMQTFSLLQSGAASGKWLGFALLIAAQVLFYADVLLHTAVSLSRALVTLGWLPSEKTRKRLDRALLILAALLLVLAAVSVTRTQLIMFVH